MQPKLDSEWPLLSVLWLLQNSMVPVEEALNHAQQEVAKLKASLKNYEGLIETYKNQVRAPQRLLSSVVFPGPPAGRGMKHTLGYLRLVSGRRMGVRPDELVQPCC